MTHAATKSQRKHIEAQTVREPGHYLRHIGPHAVADTWLPSGEWASGDNDEQTSVAHLNESRHGASVQRQENQRQSAADCGRARDENEGEVMDDEDEDIVGEPTKRCPHCERVLAVSEFQKNRCTRDGLNAQCKRCVMHYGKDRTVERRNSKRASHGEKLFRGLHLTGKDY